MWEFLVFLAYIALQLITINRISCIAKLLAFIIFHIFCIITIFAKIIAIFFSHLLIFRISWFSQKNIYHTCLQEREPRKIRKPKILILQLPNLYNLTSLAVDVLMLRFLKKNVLPSANVLTLGNEINGEVCQCE